MVAARTKVAALGEEVESTQAKIERMGASYKDAANSLGDLVNTILNSSDTWGRLSEALNNTNTAISGNIDSNKELNDVMQFALGVIVNTNPHLQHLALGFGLNTQNLKLFKEEIQATSFSLGVLNDLYLESPWALPEIEPVGEMELKDFHPLLDKNRNEIVIESLKEMTKWAKEFNKTKIIPDDFVDDSEKALQQMNKFASILANSVVGAKSLKDAFQKMSDAIISEIGRMAAEVAARGILFSIFGGMFGFDPSLLGKFAMTGGVAHQGGLITNNGQVQRFATGGTVQGGDNVPILAQGGEFVMSRSAVESIGIENLNRMNQGASLGSLTVHIKGNLLTEEYVETELAEKVETAVRRGVDFGLTPLSLFSKTVYR